MAASFGATWVANDLPHGRAQQRHEGGVLLPHREEPGQQDCRDLVWLDHGQVRQVEFEFCCVDVQLGSGKAVTASYLIAADGSALL